MTRKLKLIALSSLLPLAATVFSLYGQEQNRQEQGPKDEKHPSFWMKKKLEYSQSILAGLVKEDFDAIAKSAKQMQTLGKIEEFVRGRHEDYQAQLKNFNFANRELIRLSEEENIDGTALAYMQLTLSCINCHRHLRDQAK